MAKGDQMTATMTRDQASALRTAHDTDAKLLNSKTKAELVAIERSELAAAGRTRAYGGPVTRQEYLSAILNLRYPITRLNEAIHVLHHQPGIVGSSACQWCRCQYTWRYAKAPAVCRDYLAQCTGKPGHDGDHADTEHPEAGTVTL